MKRWPENTFPSLQKVRGSLQILGFLLAFAVNSLSGQQTSTHPRIEQTEAQGRRIDLKTLTGARLFVGPSVKPNRQVPLIIHFHGAPWLIQHHVARHLPRAALITVQLGAGSSVYGRPFGEPEAFDSLVAEASEAIGPDLKWSSITLTGFSAGYGAVRAILRHDENFERVNNVLLLDGIHAGYAPEGTPAQGGTVNSADLDSFVRFAREAAAGKKNFVLTHSEIFPGSYASTTECVDYLLAALDLKRRPEMLNGPAGMRQYSKFNAKGLHVRGYAGNTAPDHVDHLHAMPAWFKLVKVR